jgi:hypothetical protein
MARTKINKDQATGLTDADFAAANIDGVAGTASLRTLGTGSTQAAAGNDSRFPAGLTTNKLTKAASATTLGDSTVTDDGTTVTVTKNMGYSLNGPPTLATTVNDYSPGDGVYFALTAAAGGSTITGFANPTNGRVLIIENAGTDTITLSSGAGSLTANRIAFKTSGASTIILSTKDCATLIYSGSLLKWLVVCPTLPQIHNHQSNAQGGLLSAAAIAAEAWTAFTPTITAQTGTPTTTSATGRYIQIGKTVICQMDVTITTVGTAAGSIKASLPATAAANVYAGSTYEYNTSGKSGAAVILGSAGSQNDATHVWFRDATGTTLWVNGYKVAVTIVYEAA